MFFGGTCVLNFFWIFWHGSQSTSLGRSQSAVLSLSESSTKTAALVTPFQPVFHAPERRWMPWRLLTGPSVGWCTLPCPRTLGSANQADGPCSYLTLKMLKISGFNFSRIWCSKWVCGSSCQSLLNKAFRFLDFRSSKTVHARCPMSLLAWS